MIKGILFDLGGTLLEVPDPAEIVKSFLDERGVSKSLQEVSSAVSKADRSFAADFYVGGDYWKEWNVRILTQLGVSKDRDSIAAYIDSHWFEKAKVTLYPEVTEVLDEISKRGIRMGAVTNGMCTDLPYLIDDAGLSPYFQVRVSADIAGRKKPNPRIFLHAARSMGLPPSQILFVGDELELDYRASEAVGMTPVLCWRGEGTPLVGNLVTDLKGVLSFL